jgi:long-subunit acyl-CoA synthetase (AMP-forming)
MSARCVGSHRLLLRRLASHHAPVLAAVLAAELARPVRDVTTGLRALKRAGHARVVVVDSAREWEITDVGRVSLGGPTAA